MVGARGDAPLHRRSSLAALLFIGAVVLLAGGAAGVLRGAVALDASDVLSVVVQRTLPVGVIVEDAVTHQIVWDLRLPRVLLAAVVGAALAVSGATLQTAVRNPLADPFLLGVSGGASFGAVAVLVLAPPALRGVGVPVAALLGAVAAFGLVAALARTRSGTSPERLVLAGVVVGSVLSALTAYLIFQTRSNQAAQGALHWLLGSLGGASWDDLGVPTAALLAGSVVLLAQAPTMDALAAGDDVAASVGVAVDATRWSVITTACLLTGTAVAVSGIIGFLGLVVPHLVRPVVGVGHARVLPGCAVVGAALLVVVDLASRIVVAPEELPLGVVTALVGAPVFLVLQRRQADGGAP